MNFAACLKVILVEEGGYVNNPKDPGGATMEGVTQRVYDAFRRNLAKPILWVKKIAPEEVEAIYREQYWDKIWGDQLPAGVDLMVFDEAVNSGVTRSVKDLQGLLGVGVDGVLGHVTMSALAGVGDKKELIGALYLKRMGFLRRLKTWRFFSKGWSARCGRVEKAALGMVG